MITGLSQPIDKSQNSLFLPLQAKILLTCQLPAVPKFLISYMYYMPKVF